jgi:hypothetical protein
LVDIPATNARKRGNVGDKGSPVINDASRMLQRFKPQSRGPAQPGCYSHSTNSTPCTAAGLNSGRSGRSSLKIVLEKNVRKAFRAANMLRSERAENGEISFAGRSESNDDGRPSSSGTFATRRRISLDHFGPPLSGPTETIHEDGLAKIDGVYSTSGPLFFWTGRQGH